MPPLNRNINRPMPFRMREEAAVPEAGQQQEDMMSTTSTIPETNERYEATGHMPDAEDMPAAGTVITGIPAAAPTKQVIGRKEIQEARTAMQKYKQGKSNLETRIVEDELWWELRQWEAIESRMADEERREKRYMPKPTSAWLFNSIVNKHADAMDNYPEPLVLPRELGDKQSAETLSSILPVLMEYNDFEDTYSSAWWDKLVHGTAVYQVLWDSTKENGLGEITVKSIDVLSIFWEPGISNLQDSRNLFVTELVDTDLLEQRYPGHKGKLNSDNGGDTKKYLFQDNVDTTGKSTVIDWYYKKQDPSGRKNLHYCKLCNDDVLYSSENDPKYAARGFYDHGLYPFVFDILYPKKGTPAGFGVVSVCRDPQLYIDQLSANLLQTSMMGSKRRYFASDSLNINLDDFADWGKDIVTVNGVLDPNRLREIEVTPPAPIYTTLLQMKIEEMKDTSSNRDVNSGGAGSGITSGAAIAALQESGNKTSRDSIRRTYKACADIYKLVIELIRQFYDTQRAFRITGANESDYRFVGFSNAGITDQPVGISPMTGEELFRRPIFDVKVQAQKRNPFSTMEANQRASELYGMGFFNPDRAQEAIGALEMMEFEGIDDVRKTVEQGHTLQNMVMQQNQIIQQMAAMLGLQTGGAPTPSGAPAPQQGGPANGISANTPDNRPRTSYMNRLAARSGPNMDLEGAVNPAGR